MKFGNIQSKIYLFVASFASYLAISQIFNINII